MKRYKYITLTDVICQDSIFFSGNGITYVYAFDSNIGILCGDRKK